LKIEVSNGEIFDKLSILEVKSQKITDNLKLQYVNKEHQYLKQVVSMIDFSLDAEAYKKLRDINFQLWDIEDEIRLKEEQADFGDRFIELSRLIYTLNDERFRLKKKINIETGSDFHEQKGHKAT
jgi:hypothetical protein|tara:strand:+ start:1163 stop:1537 length:375 start_codon:yes stop_codon:yes gene_type:complete